jgi:hypothetical protein
MIPKPRVGLLVWSSAWIRRTLLLHIAQKIRSVSEYNDMDGNSRRYAVNHGGRYAVAAARVAGAERRALWSLSVGFKS